MLSSSVNTNVGAMIALQNLNATNAELAATQSRINTGKKVASAKDNGAIWAIAQGQRADIGALAAVNQSLDRGIAAVDVAMAAGETVSDLLLQMKEKACPRAPPGWSRTGPLRTCTGASGTVPRVRPGRCRTRIPRRAGARTASSARGRPGPRAPGPPPRGRARAAGCRPTARGAPPRVFRRPRSRAPASAGRPGNWCGRRWRLIRACATSVDGRLCQSARGASWPALPGPPRLRRARLAATVEFR